MKYVAYLLMLLFCCNHCIFKPGARGLPARAWFLEIALVRVSVCVCVCVCMCLCVRPRGHK